MTSRATQHCLTDRMRPVGRGLESPDLECQNQHAVITYASNSNGIKILTLLETVWGDVILVQCPFK